METPFGTLHFTINAIESSPSFIELPTHTKQFSVKKRLFHQFDFLSVADPVKLECTFDSIFPCSGGPCSGENLIAMCYTNETFSLAIGFACDFPQVLPKYEANKLILNISDRSIQNVACRIAWSIGPQSTARDTMVHLAVDGY